MNRAANINSDSAWLAWMAQETHTGNSSPVATMQCLPLCCRSRPKQTPLEVQLFGGLGDQLELLSLVLPWGSRHSVPLSLMAEEERCRLLDPCCLITRASSLLIQTYAHPSLRAWLSVWGCSSMTPPAASKPGFMMRRPFTIRAELCVAGERKDKEIHCQRTAAPCPFHWFTAFTNG